MRHAALCLLILCASLAHAQLVNGDFEAARPATAPPNNVWTLKTGLLPEGWGYNGNYGGPVGLVEGGHGGKYALSFSASGNLAHALGTTLPAKAGDVFELSAWAKNGTAELCFYDNAETRWLRTTPAVARIEAGADWEQGGGYYLVSDPAVTSITVVLSTDHDGVTVDDVVLRKVEAAGATGPDLTLETQNCTLVLGADGTCKSMYDKTLKEERLAGQPRPLMTAKVGAWNLPLTGLTREGNLLQATFGGGKAQATIQCDLKPYFIGLRLKSSTPQLTGLTLVDLNLKTLGKTADVIGANYNDKSAVGALALHYSGLGRVQAFAGEMVNLQCGFGKHGTEQAGCALLSCPREKFEQTILDIEAAYGIPSPRILGQWPKGSPLMRRSYFFVTDLSEANCDEVIRYAKRGHFGYLLVLEDSWSHGGGTFAINERNFPHGIDGLKATVAKLHKAGFRVGLHILSAGMRPSDPLVSPVPDKGIFTDTQVPLAGAIDEKADFIPTAAPPSKFATASGYNESGTYVRLGDEIISYGAVKLDPPYGLLRCQRGALKSTPTAHQAGEAVQHMMMSYGLFLIDADSDLMGRVADNVAKVVNYCDTDGFYYDGCERLQGDHWYYNAKIQDAYYSRFKRRDMTLQGSSFSHFGWHWIAREASADGFAHIKEYLDKRAPSFAWYFNNLMPLDVGWYAVNDDNRPDSIEYICAKATGYESSISIETGIQQLNRVPQAPEVIDMIARWEDLRLSGRVTDEIRAKLREPGKEYHLATLNGQEVLIPVEYSGWAVCPEGTTTKAGKEAGEVESIPAPQVLTAENARAAAAKVQLQLECGAPVRPGRQYETGQDLELFEAQLPPANNAPLGTNQYNPATHGYRATRDGVTQELSLVTDDVKEGKSACRFSATSTLKSVGGWATFGKAFEKPLSLKDYKYIGLWVKGDGKGEALKVQLWDTRDNPQDQYVPINWTGWRFIELPRPKPDVIDTTSVRSINFYYNGMPADSTCTILIDGVKVISQATQFENPTLQVNGKPVTFAVTLNPGDRLLYEGGQHCTVYPVGQEKRTATVQGAMEALPQKLEVTAVNPTHQVRLRAALLWPTQALKVPKQ